MGMLKMRQQRENEQKREAVSKWLSSFTVTAVVAVVAVVARSNPPTADLTLRTVGDQIVYRANVSDPDQKITEDSLQISISGPLETYEESIPLGLSIGTFTMDQPNTEYKVAVKASLGYGLETLISRSIVSEGVLGGAIVDFYLDPTIDLATDPYSLNYFIRTLYADPKNELSEVTLYYDYVETRHINEESSTSSEQWSSWIPANAYTPSYPYSISISELDQESIIYEIPNWNYTVFLRLVGIKELDQSQVILDEMTFTTPYVIHASFYLSDVGPNYAKVYIYPPEMLEIDVEFTVNLHHNGSLIRSIPVVFQTQTMEGEMGSSDSYTYQYAEITLDGLDELSFYTAELWASYVDPGSGESVNRAIRTIDFTTFPAYSVEVDYVESEQSYAVTLTVHDPNYIFQDIFYNVYDTSTQPYQYLEYGNFMTMDQGPDRIYTATIMKYPVAAQSITILANKAFEGNNFWGCELYVLEA